MADIKLYQIKDGQATSKSVADFKYESEIQKLCEQNLETFFGIRFLASEYSTGNKHRGRIDSLGIDENNCPVIIEYKLVSKVHRFISCTNLIIQYLYETVNRNHYIF